MNYSRKYIEALNKDNNFIQNNLEKVVRLLDVLKFISTELDPYGDKLVLKGGTAFNLIYTNLARLSVDIDLDSIIPAKSITRFRFAEKLFYMIQICSNL